MTLSYTYLLDDSSRVFLFSFFHIASHFFLGILVVLLNPLVHKYSNKSDLKKNVSIQVALMILGGLLGSLFGGLVVKVFLHQFGYTNESVEPIYFAMFVASLFYVLVFIFTFHFEFFMEAFDVFLWPIIIMHGCSRNDSYILKNCS